MTKRHLNFSQKYIMLQSFASNGRSDLVEKGPEALLFVFSVKCKGFPQIHSQVGILNLGLRLISFMNFETC